jgi:hypothetical protein
VKLLGCNRSEVVESLVGSLVVEEVDPVQSLEFDVLDAVPRALGANQLGLVEPDLGLGQRNLSPFLGHVLVRTIEPVPPCPGVG